MKKIKPGWKTTEFWKSIITAVIGIALTLGWLRPEEATNLNQGLMMIMGGIITVAPIVAYIISRGMAKK